MRLSYDAQVLEAECSEIKVDQWFAGLRYRRPRQTEDGYAWRVFNGPDAEARAREWLATKLNPENREPE